MKKHKFLIWNISILITLILAYELIEFFLTRNNLAFTLYVTYSVIVISALFLLSIIMYIIIHIFKFAFKKGNSFFLRIMSCILAISIFIVLVTALLLTPVISAFRYQSVHIVEKNGKTMIANVDTHAKLEISYYNYKNIFLRGKQVMIEEDCGRGGSDPFNDGVMPFVYKATYYDDNGNIIKEFNRYNDIPVIEE